jgi:hypothetical protein
MKKPRIEAFDPNSSPKLQSPLDNMPAIQPPKPDRATSSPPAFLPSANKVVELGGTPNPYGRTGVRTDGRRTITRYAFEIYQDQVETFRHLALEEKMRGGKGSMSEMVREALDAYIAKKKEGTSP